MTEQEIVELAAILVNEHGTAALEIAERRRAQHAHEPNGDSYRLWTRIAESVARLVRRRSASRDRSRDQRFAAATPPPFAASPSRGSR